MNWEVLTQIALVVLGSNWVGQFLIEVYKTKSKKKTPAEIILKCLSRKHLLDSAEEYKAQGYIPADEYDDVFEEYNAYVKLKGNGRVEREYGENGELRKLPVK